MDSEKKAKKLELQRKYYAENKEKVLAKKKEYYKLNKDSISEKKKKHYKENKQQYSDSFKSYYSKNKETINARNNEWYYSNLDRVKEYNETNSDLIKMRKKRWWDKNPHMGRFYCSKRRTQTINAMPSWLTEQEITQIKDTYKRCKEICIETGIEHHVDHIYPLIGKDSCGLHVPWNLRIITASDNLSKSNRIIPPTPFS